MNYATNTATLPPQPVPHTQGYFNTALAQAQASADPRFNQKATDRNGVSRGAGTMAVAGIQGAQNLAEGVAQAYQIPALDAATNAHNMLQYQTNQENFGQGLSGIAMQNDYANALAALQRNQNVMGFQGNALGGLLGSVGGSINLGSFGNYNGTYRF